MFSFDTLRVSLSWPRAAVLGALLFGGADLFQRKVLPPVVAPFHLKTPNTYKVYQAPEGLLPGIAGDSRVTINSFGVRGPELPFGTNVYRVLCLGDSVTECIRLDDSETWPAVAMQRLNRERGMPRVWVGNAGQSGFTSFYTLHFLKTSPLLKEVNCVVFMGGTADFIFSLSGLKEEMRELESRKRRKSWLETFLKGSKRTLKAPQQQNLSEEDAKGDVYVARRQARKTAEKTDQLPDLSEALERYRQHLRDIAAACRERGVRPIFVSTASVCDKGGAGLNEDILWGGKMADGRYLSEAGMCQGFELFNGVMAAVAREMDVEFVDASPLSGRRPLFYDATHFNEEGARRMAGLVADHLIANRGANGWGRVTERPVATSK